MKTALLTFTICSQLTMGAQTGTLRDRAKPYLDAAQAAGQTFVVVSSASGMPNVAADSPVTALGQSLAASTETATAPYPTTLSGMGVQVVDSAGAVRQAPIFYVSPSQINFLIPAETAAGTATVSIQNLVSAQPINDPPSATIQVQTVAPVLFTANENGQGVVAATAYHTVIPTTISVPVPVYQCLDQPGSCVSVPLQLGIDVPVFVTFYGAGLRGRSSDAAVQLTIAGQAVHIQAINALDDNGPSAGVDQLFVPIPLSLRGSGEVDVVLSADGANSNTARINIQ